MPLRSDLKTASTITSADRSPGETPAEKDVLRSVREFFSAHWLLALGISALVLIPCFWHRHIEAGDLGSHVYNAWLAQLIEHGQAPGLWLAHPWSNVLFDYLLSGLGRIFGLPVGEKISVSLAILIFFWGTFALVTAAARRAPWFLVPAMAMVAYGWTFELGFFNYYISLGLAFFALAIFWRGSGWERAAAITFVPFIYLAHPLGLMWLVAAAGYVWMAERKQRPAHFQLLLFLAAIAGIFLVRAYLWTHFAVSRADEPLSIFHGGDQLLLFGNRYRIVQILLGIFIAIALATDAIARRGDWKNVWRAYAIPLQLYLLVEVGVFLLPDGVRPANKPVALALLTGRLTSVSAVLICCVLGAMLPRKWHLIALAAIAMVFFSFLYQDTATVNRMEAHVERLVRTLPPNQRVMGSIHKPEDSRVLIQHILDRACVGYCFSYGNYEPTSEVFRVRARTGNHYVMTDPSDTASMELGDYTVEAKDLPAYQVYQCSEDWTELCIRPLEEGEDNDRLGIHPDE
ncbi:MAG: hypothetical protein ACRD59_12235 [Candidatus Acidiferrales bacterium]